MTITLRSDQSAALTAGLSAIEARRKLLVVSPTGSGKSFILAALLEALYHSGAVLLVPNLDIAESVYRKLSGAINHSGLSEAKVRASLAFRGIFTSKQYHNLLMKAAVDPPSCILSDEAHHDTDDTHAMIRALAGDPPMVGVTATGFRGTPEETQKLRELWGAPYIALTLRDAVRQGIIAKPDFSVWPLLNDDEIAVTNGEFQTKAVENAITTDVVVDLVERMGQFVSGGKWDRPTLIACPGVLSAKQVQEAMQKANLPAVVVTGDTSSADRQKAFTACLECDAAIVQVKVVGEGVDLAIRRLIDLAPTMSPVAWMQRVGRETRPVGPGEAPPEYIATNHNLTRHAYLWAGLIPAAQIKAAQQAWGPNYKPKRRTLARALGLEGFGKFLVTPVPMCDGSYGSLYSLQTRDGLQQYGVFLHPCMEDPLYFERENTRTGKMITKILPDGKVVEYPEKDFGRWKRRKDIPNAEGYLSVKPGHMTPGQEDFWRRAAGHRGLDETATPDARQFTVLPMFLHTGVKFKPEE